MSGPAAFLSYARLDDENNDGHLSQLRVLMEREMRGLTGDTSFRIFQDQEDLKWGQQWQDRINESINGSLLLVPVISPLFFKRQACRDELQRFLDREKKLGRDDLILPSTSLMFQTVPSKTKTSWWRASQRGSVRNGSSTAMTTLPLPTQRSELAISAIR